MIARPEDRYRVDFPVFLSWQGADGAVQRVAARCLDLSPSGAKLETQDPLPVRGSVFIDSAHFGRMGTASVRFCTRKGMRYQVGLQFSFAFSLSDPGRKKILRTVLDTSPGEPQA